MAEKPDNSDAFSRNSAWVLPGDHTYNTTLDPAQEKAFGAWVSQNNVPFDITAPVSDYDMRGFWQALQAGDSRAKSAVNPNDQQIHYPDYWKTPYHKTFSAESQWADPKKAPVWNEQDQLVLPNGSVIYDERAARIKNLMDQQNQVRDLIKNLNAPRQR